MSADQFHQFETADERRARWEAAALDAGREIDRNALAAYMAVADAEQKVLADNWAHSVGSTDGEIRRLKADLATATEFRLEPAPPNFTPLIVRRDPTYDGTRWTVLHDPGDIAVRRVWTPEGWEMAWASKDEEIYCWPDAAAALAAARQAQAEYEENDGNVDGVGRTPESYRDQKTPTGTTGWPGDEHAEPGMRGWTA